MIFTRSFGALRARQTVLPSQRVIDLVEYERQRKAERAQHQAERAQRKAAKGSRSRRRHFLLLNR